MIDKSSETNQFKLSECSKILKYLDYFSDSANKFYSIESGSMDPYLYSKKVNEFIKDLYAVKFIYSFDYNEWYSGEGKHYFDNPELIAKMELQDLRKIVTAFVRSERFCSGTIAEMIDKGLIIKILKRLNELVL
ncbi:hypothetical protein KA977_12860 [Candidatus Dependentiae bacterium]|nr:hypothetical protein [Candidatus Dependentiae bacterium]